MWVFSQSSSQSRSWLPAERVRWGEWASRVGRTPASGETSHCIYSVLFIRSKLLGQPPYSQEGELQKGMNPREQGTLDHFRGSLPHPTALSEHLWKEGLSTDPLGWGWWDIFHIVYFCEPPTRSEGSMTWKLTLLKKTKQNISLFIKEWSFGTCMLIHVRKLPE